MIRRKIIALNSAGHPIGETHPGAKHSDHDISLIRELYEEHRITLTVLAAKFETSAGYIWDIVNYRVRAQTPTQYRTSRARSSTTQVPG